MAHSLPRYQPSGFFRPLTMVVFAGAIVAGCLVAWLYQMGVRFIPFVQLKAVLVFGFGGALAWGGYRAVKLGHCRNRLLAGLLGRARPTARTRRSSSTRCSPRSSAKRRSRA